MKQVPNPLLFQQYPSHQLYLLQFLNQEVPHQDQVTHHLKWPCHQPSSLICSEHILNRLVFNSKLMSTPVALALVPSPTSVRKEPNMPIRCNDADGLSNGVSTTVVPSLSPTIKPSVVVVVVFGVVYFCYRKRKNFVTPWLWQGAGDETIPTSEMRSNVCYNVVIKEIAFQTNPSYGIFATKSREIVMSLLPN